MSSESEVLKQFMILKNLYLLGTLETGLTIYNQQVRALNLVWSIVETVPESLGKVAVIGGGVAGLTAAAGLLKKGVKHVAVFEKRATLCPLQQGSDTRWVHPRIYDWPNEDSRLPTAGLPLLNWNAGRASDVAVQIVHAWEKLVDQVPKDTVVEVYRNVKHLRLDNGMHIDWVGERASQVTGDTKHFDAVILAVGFGLERRAVFPYWRNETLGQPELNPDRHTYLISGYGDGALVDLFRIRIANFRQDRILIELCENNEKLMNALEQLKRNIDEVKIKQEELYDHFNAIAKDPEIQFDNLLTTFRRRLRDDTVAVLHLKQGIEFKDVFANKRSSFQNRFLLFALYRAGGVIPGSSHNLSKLRTEYGISESDIIYRHGTNRLQAVQKVMDRNLLEITKSRLEELKAGNLQPATICWKGGYWDKASRELVHHDASEATKAKWRKEYLPEATELFTTGFIAAVAGYLDSLHCTNRDFRVTLHRTLFIGPERLLQQSSRYIGGKTERLGDVRRTFEFENGTIGFAARTQKVIRSRRYEQEEDDEDYRNKLQADMKLLEVDKGSQHMGHDVRSVLAIPILTSDKKEVLAVLFADSTSPNIFNDPCIRTLTMICQHFASQIEQVQFDRIKNFPISTNRQRTTESSELSRKPQILEAVDQGEPPYALASKYLNIEFTDFIVSKRGAD